MRYLYIGLFVLSFLCESSLTTIPFTLIFLLIFTILTRNSIVFAIALFFGFLLDVVTLKPVGQSGLFYILFLFLILLYQRKYEINSLPFVFWSSFLGSLAYLLVFRYPNILVQSFFSSLFAGILYFFFKSMAITNERIHFEQYK